VINIGMDLHKKHTVFCAIDSEEAIVARGKVESTEEGWRGLVTRWPVAEVKVAFETGTLSWWAVDVVRSAGIEPVVVDARHFKLIRESKKKCDRRDAFHLADGLRAGLAQQCAVTVPSEKARRGRALLQARATVVRQSTASKNAVLGLLRSVGVSVTLRQWNSEVAWEAVLAVRAIPDWMKELLILHRQQWKAAEKAREELDRRTAQELHAWEPAKRLLEIPGYGPLVTLAVVTSIDDPSRFRSKEVGSYAGLAPTVRASGKKEGLGGITRQGRPLLRTLLIQAGLAAMRSRHLSPGFTKLWRRLYAQRGRQLAAAALGRRLLVLGHKLMKNGQHYDPNYPRKEAPSV
jgi:transposase